MNTKLYDRRGETDEPTEEYLAELAELEALADSGENEYSERQGDMIARFRAEY